MGTNDTNVTALQLSNMMLDNSILIFMQSGSNPIYQYLNLLPPGSLNGGMFIITKHNAWRVHFEYFETVGTNRAKYYTFLDSTSIHAWKRLATAESPTGHQFTFAPGYSVLTGASRFYRTQENVVVINLAAAKTSAIVAEDLVVTLPVGFRPSGAIHAPAVFTSPSGIGHVSITLDGEIRVKSFGVSSMQINVMTTFITS